MVVLLYIKGGYIMLFIRTTNVIKPAGGGPGNGGGGNIITPR